VPSQTVADAIMNESIDRLRSHFGLTLAEARLALQLVAGETLRSAAVNPPPLKWSDLRYVFNIKEDCNGNEAIQA
jgi:hypothetical protein